MEQWLESIQNVDGLAMDLSDGFRQDPSAVILHGKNW